MAAAASVRREVPMLRDELHHVGREVWREGREAARGTLEKELDVDALPFDPSRGHFDDASALTSGSALAAAWGAAALATILAADEDSSMAKELASVARGIDGSVRRTAATETARAFNDERNTALVILGRGDDDRSRSKDAATSPTVFKVWSAVLDARTCAACWGADGQVVEAAASFKAGIPPLHPNCRCVVEHVIVPKPERIEDIGIDYELFKQELRDVLRENRLESQRHALDFVSESLGSKRSPTVLTKRFANEPYATKR